jgi:hypothetical protein
MGIAEYPVQPRSHIFKQFICCIRLFVLILKRAHPLKYFFDVVTLIERCTVIVTIFATHVVFFVDLYHPCDFVPMLFTVNLILHECQ